VLLTTVSLTGSHVRSCDTLSISGHRLAYSCPAGPARVRLSPATACVQRVEEQTKDQTQSFDKRVRRERQGVLKEMQKLKTTFSQDRGTLIFTLREIGDRAPYQWTIRVVLPVHSTVIVLETEVATFNVIVENACVTTAAQQQRRLAVHLQDKQQRSMHEHARCSCCCG
jgi:hypothetical protein